MNSVRERWSNTTLHSNEKNQTKNGLLLQRPRDESTIFDFSELKFNNVSAWWVWGKQRSCLVDDVRLFCFNVLFMPEPLFMCMYVSACE